MFRIKRLYTFIYQTFIPIFVMTFGICLFIFIIQFLWQHIDKLVGKGLESTVIAEFFITAALMLVPQVLPLAILLASLMTFGNMGERLELLAIKASGVSLMHIMKPMIILISLITIGSFVFQNKLTPILSVKVYSLLYSIKQKAPAIDIPEGAFYSEIKGYSIYVKEKDLETHMLRDVIIYDLSKGSGNNSIAVDVCDSALLVMEDNTDYLTLTMFNGERFQNSEKDGGARARNNKDVAEVTPYVREVFEKKQIIIPIKGDLERIDESRFSDSQLSKGLASLQTSIDSMSHRVDSLNIIDRELVANQSVISYRTQQAYKDSVELAKVENPKADKKVIALDFDSVYNSYSIDTRNEILSTASVEARNKATNHLMYFHVDMPKPNIQRSVRLHEIYWHKMFTLPFACLIFFFIGAPLGSIIRKGGLGVPVVISVVLFIIYYIIGNIGYKMARDGLWPAWQGEWLSAAVLFPLGAFLTYKSMNESTLFNTELYGKYIRKVLRIKEPQDRVRKKDITNINIPRAEDIISDTKTIADYRALDTAGLKDMALNYIAYGHEKEMGLLATSILLERNEDVSSLLAEDYYDYKEAAYDLFIKTCYWSIGAYILTIATSFGTLYGVSNVIDITYILLYIRSLILYIYFFSKTTKPKKVKYYTYHGIVLILTFVAFPLMFFYTKWKMGKELNEAKDMSFFTTKQNKN